MIRNRERLTHGGPDDPRVRLPQGETAGPTLAAAVTLGWSLISAVAVLATPGAQGAWCLVLTAGQVLAMQGASRDRRWGWLLGLGLQAPWGAYALATDQFAFLATCVLCAVAQVGALRRLARGRRTVRRPDDLDETWSTPSMPRDALSTPTNERAREPDEQAI